MPGHAIADSKLCNTIPGGPLPLVLACCFLAACSASKAGADGRTNQPPDSGQTPDAGPGPITGSLVDTYFPGNGQSLKGVSANLTTVGLRAIVALPDGGALEFPAQISDAGTFRIDGVPNGPYLLKYADGAYGSLGTFLVENSRQLDLGGQLLGRPDAVRATSSTQVSISATGMDPWDPYGDLELVSFGAGGAADGLQYVSSTALSAGQTSLQSFTVDWKGLPIGLVKGSEGDTALVVQLSKSGANPSVYVASKVFDPAQFDLTDGQPTQLSGAFTPIATQQAANIDIRTSEFDQLRLLINPNATFNITDLVIYAQPTEVSSFAAPNPVLATYSAQSTADINLGSVSFGNPFADTQPLLWYGVLYTIKEAVPGQSQSLLLYAWLNGVADSSTLAGPIHPAVGPVVAPKIAGLDAFTSQTGVGTTPLITWTKPNTGTAATYFLELRDVVTDVSGPHALLRARFVTDGTQLQMPPGILEAGHNYFLHITSDSAESLNFLEPLPGGSADCFTAVFTP